MIIIDYDLKKHNFTNFIEEIFKVPTNSLDLLHVLRKDLLPKNALTFDTETKTPFHQVFYSYLNSMSGAEIRNTYESFIEDNIAPLFSEDFLYQKFPSFRIHLPNEKAIHKWHFDSDSDHKHPLWEINFQIALTRVFGTNAMWIEAIPGIKNHKPVELSVGQVAIFDGNRCEHGNKINKTNKTRLSMDFRILPYRRYKEQEQNLLKSVTANLKFAPSDYYSLYEK